MSTPHTPRETTRMGTVLWDFEALDMRPTPSADLVGNASRWVMGTEPPGPVVRATPNEKTATSERWGWVVGQFELK